MDFLNVISFITLLFSSFIQANVNSYSKANGNFLQRLKGKISESPCTIEQVNQFNNAKIYPRISSIIMKDYFKYFKVNLKKECPFWIDPSRCAIEFCQVTSCEESSVPKGIKNSRRHDVHSENMSLKYMKPEKSMGCESMHDDLGYLNTTISASTMEDLALWQAYDDLQDSYCTLPDDDGQAQYVDLSVNPERYTGYRGDSPHRIWTIIYKENCFRPENMYEIYIQSSKLSGMCLEKRAFYRAISGLHASINIHLCAQYLQQDSKILGSCSKNIWGVNIDEFRSKFAPEFTNNEGPQWLKNLYFLYLVELRALAKVSRYLKMEEYYTGNDKEDEETKNAILNFLEVVKQFPDHFNESVMFSGGDEAKILKEEFRRHFRNISSIMDCVACEKCKLWGKLQVQGLGTAFKILFSDKLHKVQWTKNPRKSFRLERSEIVALFNAFARLSTSIYELENFRELLR